MRPGFAVYSEATVAGVRLAKCVPGSAEYETVSAKRVKRSAGA